MNTQQGPRHIAIIMDGNGRWAQRRGLPRTLGHRAGADAVLNLLKSVREFGVRYLTLYAFSTENWNRPAEEVGKLMSMLGEFLDRHSDELNRRGIRLRMTGRLSGLPETVRGKLASTIERTAGNSECTLVLALNYGGRQEIADAAAKLAADAVAGRIRPEEIDERRFADCLYLPDVPDPELMIRTGGEYRLSNFLLWELSYTELYVTDVFWPDFDKDELKKAIDAYRMRDRRFGKIK